MPDVLLDGGNTATTINGYQQWRDAPARAFLNGTGSGQFMGKAFSPDQWAQIADTTVITPGMVNTLDKLFLPSAEEFYTTYKDKFSIETEKTPYSASRISSEYQTWSWLRTSNGEGRTNFDYNGSLKVDGNSHLVLGLRPMMWLELDSANWK